MAQKKRDLKVCKTQCVSESVQSTRSKFARTARRARRKMFIENLKAYGRLMAVVGIMLGCFIFFIWTKTRPWGGSSNDSEGMDDPAHQFG